MDDLRSKGRWSTQEFDETLDLHQEISAISNVDTPEELLIQVSEHQELEKRIDQLPDRQRVALVAWLQHDGDQKELARQLGMTLKSLEMLLVRAKKGVLRVSVQDEAEAAR